MLDVHRMARNVWWMRTEQDCGRSKRALVALLASANGENSSRAKHAEQPSRDRLRPRSTRPAESALLPDVNQGYAPPTITRTAHLPTFHIHTEHAVSSVPQTSEPRPDHIEEEERSGLEIASAALGQPERTGEVPFYTGRELP